MEADAKLRQAAIEEQVAVQYLAAQMNVMAGAGKIGPLEQWLDHVRPKKPRSVRDWLLAFEDAAARGAPIRITKVKG